MGVFRVLTTVALTAGCVAFGAGPALAATAGSAAGIRAPIGAAADPLADLGAVACPDAGWCMAGGAYDSAAGRRFAMVVMESGGRWARARRLRMPPNAVAAQFAGSQLVSSIACTPRLVSCVAVGLYQTASSSDAFVAVGSRGHWARARELRLPANASSIAPSAALNGVSCWRAGWCVAVGGYFDRGSRAEAMVAAESHGRWGRAAELAVPAGAAADPGADLTSVTCLTGRRCVAVGGYETSRFDKLGLAAAGSPAQWHLNSIRLPANAAAGSGLNFRVYDSVSCRPGSSCVAVGSYYTRSGNFQAVTARMSRGKWSAGRKMPLPRAAARGPSAGLTSVSCTPAFCEAAGWFTARSGAVLAMAVRQSHGHWGPAAVAGLPANARGGASQTAGLDALTCTRAWSCTAAGSFLNRAGRERAMVTTRL